MQHFHEHDGAESDSFNLVLDQTPVEFLEAQTADGNEGGEADSPAEESPYTDDPVRV